MSAVTPLPGMNLEFLQGLKPHTLTDQEQNVIIALALQILEYLHTPGELFSSPEASKAFLRLRLAENVREVFGCIFLDNRNRIIAVEDLFFGTVDGASVHIRVVIQRALAVNAAALICYHNHPSGLPEPSQADIQITRRIKEALALIEVRMLDHIVVAGEGVVSFAERSLL